MSFLCSSVVAKTRLALILIFGLFAFQGQAQSLNSSTFVFSQDVANITFTLTAVADTNDLIFRLSAPAEYDWVAIGVGASMKDALIFMVYPAKNGTAPILSPRLSTGNTEPTYAPNIALSPINDPAFPNVLDATSGGNQMLLTAICRNCTSWSKPPLDLTSTAAPFMFAFGPINDQTTSGWFNGAGSGSARWSDSLSNPLRSHTIHGQFTMNMQQATVSTNPNLQLPTLGNSSAGASLVRNIKVQSFDFLSGGHAILMCLVFAFWMPLDVLLRMFIKWVGLRIFMASISFILFVAGLVLGFIVSPQFIRSKNFNSAHQVLGIFILLLFLTHTIVGCLANRKSKTSSTPEDAMQNALTTPPPTPRPRLSKFTTKPSISTIAEGLAFFTFLLAIIDVGIGFDLAIAPSYNKKWVPLIISVIILCIIVYTIRWFMRKNKKDDAEEEQSDREIKMQRLQYAQEQAARQYAPPQYSAQDNVQAQPGYGYGVPAQYGNARDKGGVVVGEEEVRYQAVAIPARQYS